MKNILLGFCFVGVILSEAQPDIPRDWITMVDPCTKKMTEQIQEELTAAMTYLAMGAHFSKDTINRPGIAEYFFKSASEEREHAIKLIDYLLMRGELTHDIKNLIKDPMPDRTHWENGHGAFKHALSLENHVTNKIRDIIITCETPVSPPFNDYHLVDYLTGEYLDEQHKGQRELAGMISILGKMLDHHGTIGEFLFDKKLSSNELF
ncbi:secreted ferritin S subunit precursor, putative [Pediculus humanus corporis]|uniref:Ferritin n=1 Tax=Pediculus humanus subsp. corporis TaxID=121224 RepID=E0VGF9_PEDHC|nr:secreted ferritin S subunit precursor, putative [Pediculus humanus corporis]EEB12465.1 secreted ferritin S subunit precursor, putative [Pediculus humanus corporis]